MIVIMNRLKDILVKILPLAAVISLSLAGTGCTGNFEEYNIDRSGVDEETMEKDDLSFGSFFGQMQRNVFAIKQGSDFGSDVYQRSQNLSGDIYCGYMGVTNNWFGNINGATYYMIPEWYNHMFSITFTRVMPAWKQIRTKTEADYPHKFAVAELVKVLALLRTTDNYGPLPVSNFGSSISTEYDTQEEVYTGLLADLDAAIDVLTDYNQSYPSATIAKKYDNIFAGDVVKWIKFGNTLKLRMAMRLAYRNATLARAKAEEAVAHPIGVMETVDEGAIFGNGGVISYMNPLWEICFNFNDIRMGATMESYLKGYDDPRMAVYFQPAAEIGRAHV